MIDHGQRAQTLTPRRVFKGGAADFFDALRDGHALELTTALEGAVANFRDVFRDRHALEVYAAFKGSVANLCDAFRDGHLPQVPATPKGMILNRGDAFRDRQTFNITPRKGSLPNDLYALLDGDAGQARAARKALVWDMFQAARDGYALQSLAVHKDARNHFPQALRERHALEIEAPIAIQEIIKEYQRQKTNQRSRKGGSARKPQQYHAEAEVII